MCRHKKEIIDIIKEFAQEGLHLSDTHIVMCKHCNVHLEGHKKGEMRINAKFLFLTFYFCEIFIFNAKTTYTYLCLRPRGHCDPLSDS
jgi:hypothetical protein